MLRIVPFDDAHAARWDDYVRRSPDSHFGQLSAWLKLTSRSYGVALRASFAEDDGRVRGVLPLFEKRGDGGALFSAPGGLLADDAGVAEALLAPARGRVAGAGLRWLELRDQRRAWPGLETSTEHVTMVLAMAGSPEEQWSRFDAKLRNQIRKGEKAEFRRRWGHEHVATFHRVLLENMRDLGTPIRGVGYYRAILEAYGEAANVLVIDKDGEPAGTMFTVEHAGTLTDPWASSLRRFFAHCPNQVLYWEALQRAFAGGVRRFDFGRSQVGSGTYEFKRQWGAEPVQLYYQYALGRGARVPTLEEQKHGFDLAVRLWKKLPIPLAGLLGEPAKRRFPEVM